MNWVDGFDAKGRPIRVPGKVADEGRHARLSRAIRAARTGTAPSYSPRTGLFYVPAWVNYTSSTSRVCEYVEGQYFGGGGAATHGPGLRTLINNLRKEDEGYGAVRAIDPLTGNLKWEYKMIDFTDAGVLTTASDVLFSGGREGYFFALDAGPGRSCGSSPSGSGSPGR